MAGGGDILSRWLSVGTGLAAILGTLGAAYALYSRAQIENIVNERTEDRYKAGDAIRDFQLRDERIKNLSEELDRLRHQYDNHISTHPDRGLQRQINEHVRDGHGP